VKSLVASNCGQEPPKDEECSNTTTKLTSNEQSVYQIVRARQHYEEPTTREIIRDDLKAQGMGIKHFSRWLEGCINKGVLVCNDGLYFTAVA